MSNYVTLSLERAAALTLDAWESDPHTAPLWLGDPGIGKCLGLGTPVMLATGRVVPVEQIKVGDLLMGPDSKPRRVLSTTTGRGPLFRIEPKKGQPWVCNDVHVLTLVDSVSGEIFDIGLDKLDTLDTRQRHHAKQFHVAVDFPPHADAPLVDPYFLGVWLGDGTKNLKGGVEISKPDAEIHAACVVEATRWGLQVTKSFGSSGCPTWHVGQFGNGNPNPLTAALREVVGENITVPSRYLTGSREERLALLAGLLDTDGHLISNCYDFVQKNKAIADAAVFLARSLGLQATIREKQVPNYGTYHRVTISGAVAMIPCRVPRRRAAKRLQKKDVTRIGFAVFPLGEGDYFGFTLEGDGRFLLGDCTVTHNTHKIGELRHALAASLAPRLHERFPQFGFMLPVQAANGQMTLAPREWAFSPLEVAHGADEDIGGIPVRDAASGAVIRLPIGPIRACSDGPGVLFLDEISRAGAQKQGCSLTITNEGRAGDFALNIGSRVCLAANGVEQSGTHTIIDALLNRCLVIEIEPSADEFREYLRARVGAPGSTLRELAIDFAATSEKAPDLIQLKMPPGATESGQLWASPRAIEKAIKVFDVALTKGRSGELLFASLAGLIGKEAAGAYMSVRKVRERLPSPKEIETNPTACLVPKADDAEANIGTLGLVNIVASRNPNSAWLYAGRLLNRECGTALAKGLLRYVPTDPKATQVKFKLMAQFGVASEG